MNRETLPKRKQAQRQSWRPFAKLAAIIIALSFLAPLAPVAPDVVITEAQAAPSFVTWRQSDDTNVLWYVSAYWPKQLGSDSGPVCVAIPVDEWNGTTPGKRNKVNDFFNKLEKHEDDLTPQKLAAFLQGLPNDIDLHVYFCNDEGKSQYGSLIAGNATSSRPALEPLPSEEL